MKNLILFILFYGSLRAQSPSTPLGTQVTPVTAGFEAPAIVTSKFTTEFPNSNPSWSMLGENYAAEILDVATQLKKIIVYDKFGNRQFIASESGPGTYPKPITEYYKQNFPVNKFQIWALQKNDSLTGYYSIQKKDTLWFDTKGAVRSPKSSVK